MTSQPSILRRYGWIGVIGLPIVGSLIGVGLYGMATDWYFLLPGLPPPMRFLEDPSRMNALAEAVGVPVPPDLTDVDEETALSFHEQYGRLRQDRRNMTAVKALGRLFESLGDSTSAQACYRRAAEHAP